MDEQIINVFDRRNKIIKHNNYCIIETIAFYETIAFNEIIKQHHINIEVYNDRSTNKLFEKLSISEKYEIINEIAKEKGIQPFSKSKFDTFVNERNKVAHNIFSIGSLNIKTQEHEIHYKGKVINWSNYLKEVANWAIISKEFAKFILSIFLITNKNLTMMNFIYCSLEYEYILIERNLLYPEPSEEYISFLEMVLILI